jgi:hypothetical protein
MGGCVWRLWLFLFDIDFFGKMCIIIISSLIITEGRKLALARAELTSGL